MLQFVPKALGAVGGIVNTVFATTVGDIITTMTDDLTTTIWEILPPIFGVVVILVAVLLGYRLIRRFIK